MNDSGVPGTLYLIHFEEPYKHARHYRGWYRHPLRIQHHRNGTGARLMQVIHKAGIRWAVVVTRPGTRNDERDWKARHSATRYCPVCNGDAFVCFDCGKVYRYPGWLRRHNRLVHQR